MLPVDLPDGAGRVWIRTLSGEERGKFRDAITKAQGNGGITTEVILAMGLCEEDGVRIYDHTKEEDLAELRAMEGADSDFIAMRFLDASGLSEKAVELLQKN